MYVVQGIDEVFIVSPSILQSMGNNFMSDAMFHEKWAEKRCVGVGRYMEDIPRHVRTDVYVPEMLLENKDVVKINMFTRQAVALQKSNGH